MPINLAYSVTWNKRTNFRTTPAGKFIIIIEVVSDPDPLVDTHFPTIELICDDPSHVRDYTLQEWKQFLH